MQPPSRSREQKEREQHHEHAGHARGGKLQPRASSKIEPHHRKEPSEAAEGDLNGDSIRHRIGAKFELARCSYHGNASISEECMQANDASPLTPIDLANVTDKDF